MIEMEASDDTIRKEAEEFPERLARFRKKDKNLLQCKTVQLLKNDTKETDADADDDDVFRKKSLSFGESTLNSALSSSTSSSKASSLAGAVFDVVRFCDVPFVVSVDDAAAFDERPTPLPATPSRRSV